MTLRKVVSCGWAGKISFLAHVDSVTGHIITHQLTKTKQEGQDLCKKKANICSLKSKIAVPSNDFRVQHFNFKRSLSDFTECTHSGGKLQKPAKNEILKNREIDGSYLQLQRFDNFWMWSAGNQKRKFCEFAETCMEKLVKSSWVNLFFGGFFDIWNHCDVPFADCERRQTGLCCGRVDERV